jgi:hypothetical protein
MLTNKARRTCPPTKAGVVSEEAVAYRVATHKIVQLECHCASLKLATLDRNRPAALRDNSLLDVREGGIDRV